MSLESDDMDDGFYSQQYLMTNYLCDTFSEITALTRSLFLHFSPEIIASKSFYIYIDHIIEHQHVIFERWPWIGISLSHSKLPAKTIGASSAINAIAKRARFRAASNQCTYYPLDIKINSLTLWKANTYYNRAEQFFRGRERISTSVLEPEGR